MHAHSRHARSSSTRLASALLAMALLLFAACGPETAHAADDQAKMAPTSIPQTDTDSEGEAAKVVLTVNGKNVTRADVDRALEEAIGMPLSAIPADQRDAIRSMVGPQAESRLVLEIVLLEEAAARGIAVAAEAVDAALEDVKSSLPENVTLEAALAEAGRDVTWLREQATKGLTIEALLREAPESDESEDETSRQAAEAAFVTSLMDEAEIVRHEAAPIAPPSKAGGDTADTVGAAWHTDYEAAAKEARETGRPILANFTGSDWCPYCVKLASEVFETTAFRTWAQDNVVLLEVDFPHRPLPAGRQAKNDELRDRYGVRGFPTVLFLDAEGEIQGRSGYAPGGADAWIEDAEAALSS